eukprot:1911302-Rhodomonas_salina.1
MLVTVPSVCRERRVGMRLFGAMAHAMEVYKLKVPTGRVLTPIVIGGCKTPRKVFPRSERTSQHLLLDCPCTAHAQAFKVSAVISFSMIFGAAPYSLAVGGVKCGETLRSGQTPDFPPPDFAIPQQYHR